MPEEAAARRCSAKKQQQEREPAAETADDAKAGQEAWSGCSGDTEVARASYPSEANGVEDGDVLWSSLDLAPLR
jgi:hypothetical protein